MSNFTPFYPLPSIAASFHYKRYFPNRQKRPPTSFDRIVSIAFRFHFLFVFSSVRRSFGARVADFIWIETIRDLKASKRFGPTMRFKEVPPVVSLLPLRPSQPCRSGRKVRERPTTISKPSQRRSTMTKTRKITAVLPTLTTQTLTTRLNCKKMAAFERWQRFRFACSFSFSVRSKLKAEEAQKRPVVPDLSHLELPKLPNFFRSFVFCIRGDFSPEIRHQIVRFITAFDGLVQVSFVDALDVSSE